MYIQKLRYKIKKNNLKIIFFNSFFKINLKPQEIKVIKIKNEIKPKLCNKKSEILLPYIPKKFFIFELIHHILMMDLTENKSRMKLLKLFLMKLAAIQQTQRFAF